MKYTLLSLLVFVSLFTFSSCEDGEQRIEVPLTVSGFSVTLDDSNSWKTFSSQVVTGQFESALNTFGYSLNNVKKVEPKNIKLRITTPGQNFDNIIYLEGFVKTDNIDSVKVGYNTEIPNGQTEIPLNSQYSDITTIVTSPSFTFFVRAYNEEAFGPATGEIEFTVDVIAEK